MGRNTMKRSRKSIIGMILLLLIISFSFYSYTNHIEKLAIESAKSRLIETSENSIKEIERLMTQDSNLLRGICVQLLDETLSNQQKKEVLLSASSYTDFLKLNIYNKEGKGLQIIDHELQPYEVEVFDDIEQTKPLLLSDVQGNYIRISVPILNKNQVLVGRIEGVYTSRYISESLNIKVFEGQGYYEVIDTNGDFLWHTEEVQHLYDGDNAFDILKDATFSTDYDVEQLKTDIEHGESIFLSYKLRNENRCAYYMPTGINNWYLMAVVPSAYLLEHTAAIEHSTVLLMVIMCVAFLCMVGYVFITHRRTRNRIEQERDYLKRVINTVPAPIFIVDNQRRIVTVNQAACTQFQKEAKDLIGKPCCLIGSNICNSSNCAIERMTKQGIRVTFMEIHQQQFMVTTTFMYGKQNEKIGFVEVLQDISDLISSKRMLEEKTLELETISQNLAVGLLVTSLEEGFPIIRCNERYLELIGCEEEDVIGKLAIRWVSSEEAKDTEVTIRQQLVNQENVEIVHKIDRKDGTQIWISMFGKQMKLHDQMVGVWVLLDISAQKKIDEELRINEERYRIAALNTEDIIVDFDMKSRRIIHTERITEIYGLGEVVENVPESLVEANVIDEQTLPEFLDMFDRVMKGEKKASCDILSNALDGRKIWNHFTFITIFDSDGQPTRAIGVMHDFTKEKVAQLKYQREAQYRKMTMEDAALYYEVNLTKHIFVTGYENLVKNYVKQETNDFDVVVDLLLEHVVYIQDRKLVESFINWQYLADAFDAGKQKIEFEYRRMLGHNEFGWVMCTLYLLQDEETKDVYCLGYIKDIDESKQLELSLKHQAESDLLTGLYNKMTTETMIEKELGEHTEDFGALMIIDLDDFKSINDTLGHAFGDAVLSEISQALKTLFQDRGILGRVGGDEFIVFLNHMKRMEEIEQNAKDICDIFHHTYTGANNHYKVSGTVGIAISPKDGMTFDQLYQCADIALYYAKNNGKDTYCLYQTTLPQIGSDKMIRSIDKNAGKSFSENIVEYVLRILHDSNRPELTLNAVLELVSKHFNFSRSYLFERVEEGMYWKDAYEWCGDHVASHMQKLQQVPYEQLTPYFENFDEDGILLVHDIEVLDPVFKKEFVPDDIRSMIQFTITQDEEVVAFVGFDDCILHRHFDETEVETLHMVVMLIDVFLIKRR